MNYKNIFILFFIIVFSGCFYNKYNYEARIRNQGLHKILPFTFENPAFCGYYACMALLMFNEPLIELDSVNSNEIYRPFLNQIQMLSFLNKNSRLRYKYDFGDPNSIEGLTSPFIAFLPTIDGSNDHNHCVLITQINNTIVTFYSRNKGPIITNKSEFFKDWQKENYGRILTM